MINAFYEPFPDSITADGREYRIITDFREWFRFADMIADNGIPEQEKLLLMAEWLLDPPERITEELVDAVCDFYKADALNHIREADDDEKEEIPVNLPVLDWKIDAPYIIGDFQRFYSIDLLNTEMHWWKFRILFSALPEDSQIMKRICYRSIDLGQIKDESERRRIMKLKQLYALPYELEEDDIGAVFGNSI